MKHRQRCCLKRVIKLCLNDNFQVQLLKRSWYKVIGLTMQIGNDLVVASNYTGEWLSLTHWGRVTHICVSDLPDIGSDNGLSPGRRQAIISTNAGLLLIRTLWTNSSEIFSEINTFSFKKMCLKISSAKWRPFVSASMCFNRLWGQRTSGSM